jgi:multidrug resistance efflux pump
MSETPEDKIELRSEEVQEILSFIPHWIIRWGITLIFFILLMLLTGAWFVKYPEIVESKVSILTQSPPVKLISQSSGKITLLAADNSQVEKDTYLAVIENPASYKDVQDLKDEMEGIAGVLPASPDSIRADFDRSWQIGEIQADYAVFKQSCLDYRYFLEDNFYERKILTIENQYKFYQTLNEKLKGQKEILANELDLVQQKFSNDKSLFKQGVIAEIDYNRSQSEYLQKKYSYKNAEISLVNNGIQIEEYKKTIMDLQQQFQEKKRQYILSIQESFKRLQSAVLMWEQRYVIKSPIPGRVSYFKFYSDNQFVTSGDEILTLVPATGAITARLFVPSYGSGKIEAGQRVNIKLDNYPYKEYGMVNGKVESISETTRDNLYLVNVSLPQGLRTSYNKELDFKQEMTGTAEIITKDLRLLERIFNQIRSLLQQ